MEEKENEGRIYEVGYLLVPSISEEELPVNYGNLKELVVSLGGSIISDDMPKMIDLAYPMYKTLQNVITKFNNAYFGWVKFEMEPEKVLELKKKLDLDLSVIRFLTIKTVKENTIAAKRFVNRDAIRRKVPMMKKEGEAEEVVPINKEEVDKEIDAMVAN
ncbi:MAG: 30S ribosomal protein S6 [Candidatus Paceibacterota bacterium]